MSRLGCQICLCHFHIVSSVFCCIQNSIFAVNSLIAMTDVYKQNCGSILCRGFGAHATSYPVGTVRSFLGGKQPGFEADYSSSAEVKSGGSSIPPYVFMSWCFIN
jgi:hypothetical protein